MAKKILLKKFPDEQIQSEMISDLSEMKPERTSSLMSLMDVLKAGISKARKSGVGWDKIAAYISEKTETTVSPDAVSQSYTTLEREAKNKGRAQDELSYTQLKYRYNTALKVMKKHGIQESEIDEIIAEEKRKRKEKNGKEENNTEEKEQQQNETNTVEYNENNDQRDNTGIDRIREDKPIFNE